MKKVFSQRFSSEWWYLASVFLQTLSLSSTTLLQTFFCNGVSSCMFVFIQNGVYEKRSIPKLISHTLFAHCSRNKVEMKRKKSVSFQKVGYDVNTRWHEIKETFILAWGIHDT